MTAPRLGEVYTARLPGRPTNGKVRPVVVMSPDYRNELAHDVLVIPLTTNLRAMPTHVQLPAGAGGLKEPSMAKAEQITALPKDFLARGPLGPRLSTGLVKQLREAVWKAMGGEARP